MLFSGTALIVVRLSIVRSCNYEASSPTFRRFLSSFIPIADLELARVAVPCTPVGQHSDIPRTPVKQTPSAPAASQDCSA